MRPRIIIRINFLRINIDSIRDHIIPHVSYLKTLKEVFYALTKLLEGKNINHKMTLRNHLKNVNIWNSETMHSYFTRVSQIKENLKQLKKDKL